MDLTFGKEELAFQQEVRDWLKENLTPEIVGETKVGRNAYTPKERLIDWQKRLARKGWLCTGWPKSSAARASPRTRSTSSRWRWRGRARPAPRRSAPRCARR